MKKIKSKKFLVEGFNGKTLMGARFVDEDEYMRVVHAQIVAENPRFSTDEIVDVLSGIADGEFIYLTALKHESAFQIGEHRVTWNKKMFTKWDWIKMFQRRSHVLRIHVL